MQLSRYDLSVEILDVLLALGQKMGTQGCLPFIFANGSYEFLELLGVVSEIFKSALVLLWRANTLTQEALR